MSLFVLVPRLAALSAPDAPPTANAGAAASQTAPVAADAPVEKKICHLEESTGSNFPKRVCRTEREWSVSDSAASASVKQRGNVRPSDR